MSSVNTIVSGFNEAMQQISAAVESGNDLNEGQEITYFMRGGWRSLAFAEAYSEEDRVKVVEAIQNALDAMSHGREAALHLLEMRNFDSSLFAGVSDVPQPELAS